MRKATKTILASVLALGLSCSALVGCSSTPALEGDVSGEVVSNSGFVVQKGNYYYFINGVEAFDSSNKTGSVVKGALMRIARSDLDAGNFGKAETVVSSLMVAGDYTSGITIYGDRVYYATPTTAKNKDGEVMSSYLDMKSTKLDGTDTSDVYLRMTDNTAKYRFVEVDGTVYCMYVVNDSELRSYNTETGKETLLVDDMDSYAFCNDRTNPGVYYTMNVKVDMDKDANYTESYTQVYYVTADTTEAPYTYTFDEEFAEEYAKDHDGKAPYTNLGTIVLDGYGSECRYTQFNHNEGTTPYTPSGYTYKLFSYTNEGLYYTRSYVDTTSSTADGGTLYYLADANVKSDSWNAVSGNPDSTRADAGDYNDIVSYDTTNASVAAIFLKDGDNHSYLYAEDNAIFRADVKQTANGIVRENVRIVDQASSPSLMYVDSMGEFDYLYYSTTGANGSYLYRAVYNGEQSDYNALLSKEDYKAVQILQIDFASDWYLPEKVGNYLFFANAEAIGANSYNYICVMDVSATNGALAKLNEKYEEIDDAIAELNTKHADLGNLVTYYYWAGSDNPVFNRYYLDDGMTGATVYENTDYYHAILAQAKEEGYTDTYLYSEYYQTAFADFVAHTGEYLDKFKDENGTYYNVQSYFYHWIGEVTDEDMSAIDNVFKSGWVKKLDTEEEESFPVWAIVLIAVGGVLVSAGIALAIVLTVRAKNKKADSAPKKQKMVVDTSDDRDIDVYADENSEEKE
ncbi:MAG: hypothetical protein J5993_05580 [Clostridia bacterium]|nr:hypothetical protein [Clostridia bacterium]